MPTEHRPCWIYKSQRKDELYLYLAAADGFDAVPSALIEHFGPARLVMQIDLHPGRTLAREDVSKVIANLQAQGYHLQLPPNLRPNLYFGD